MGRWDSPLRLVKSFWILLTPSVKINAVFVLLYISEAPSYISDMGDLGSGHMVMCH